jgi:hypothetical protein
MEQASDTAEENVGQRKIDLESSRSLDANHQRVGPSPHQAYSKKAPRRWSGYQSGEFCGSGIGEVEPMTLLLHSSDTCVVL